MEQMCFCKMKDKEFLTKYGCRLTGPACCSSSWSVSRWICQRFLVGQSEVRRYILLHIALNSGSNLFCKTPKEAVPGEMLCCAKHNAAAAAPRPVGCSKVQCCMHHIALIPCRSRAIIFLPAALSLSNVTMAPTARCCAAEQQTAVLRTHLQLLDWPLQAQIKSHF